jgi:hypothetical protein
LDAEIALRSGSIHLVFVGYLVFHQLQLSSIQEIFFVHIGFCAFFIANMEESWCFENSSHCRTVIDAEAFDSSELSSEDLLDIHVCILAGFILELLKIN